MKRKIFWKIYWVLVLLLLLAIFGVWYVLYDFLGVYEAAQPVHKMDELMKLFTDPQMDQIMQYLEDTYSEDKKEDVKQYIANRLAGKELSYDNAYGADSNNSPAFRVRDEEGELCRVYLKAKEQRGRYDAKIWELDRIENLVHTREPIEIIAPEGYIVNVDGVRLDESYVIAKESDNDLENQKYLEAFGDYIELPSRVTYRVDELYLEPEVSCQTPDGQTDIERVSKTAECVYQYEAVFYENLEAALVERIESFSKTYVNYVTNDVEAAEVLQYILPDTDLYRRMATIEKTNVWTPKHSAVEFSDMEVSEYKTYGEKFFTCKLHFTYLIPYMMGNSEYDTWLRFYWVFDENDWKLAEMFIE